MVNGLDVWMTVAKESTYGTAVTTTKAVELAGKPKAFVKQQRLESKALRSGNMFGLANKSPVVSRTPGVEIPVEACSKGQGVLWEMALGAGTSTLVSAGLYQQVFKMVTTQPSYSVQLDLPMFTPATGVWSQNPWTFLGAMCTEWELSLSNAGILELKLNLDAREAKTNIGQAAPSYPSGAYTYHFGGACIYAGTISEPTTTALIDTSGLTAVANVISMNLKVNNSLSTGERRMCGAGLQVQPMNGKPKGTGTLVTDYVNTTFTAAYLADTGFSMVMDFIGNSADVTNDHLQVLVQDLRINPGDLPTVNEGKPLEQSLDFELFDKAGQTSPVIVVQRTADTAI